MDQHSYSDRHGEIDTWVTRMREAAGAEFPTQDDRLHLLLRLQQWVKDIQYECKPTEDERVREQVREYIRAGRWIDAVRYYREEFHTSLSEARDAALVIKAKMGL